MKIKCNSKSIYLSMSRGRASILLNLLIKGRVEGEELSNKRIREGIINLLEVNLFRGEKMKAINTFIADKDIKDLQGMIIVKGTKIYVMKNDTPIHPTKKYRIIIVRVDNGTGHLHLMPETAIKQYLIK